MSKLEFKAEPIAKILLLANKLKQTPEETALAIQVFCQIVYNKHLETLPKVKGIKDPSGWHMTSDGKVIVSYREDGAPIGEAYEARLDAMEKLEIEDRCVCRAALLGNCPVHK